ncbi:MAG: SGNH/GDSL hydrolase family protein [Candidatus Obscuribacterales bacterium]|nr:SGNH/GDSL hydrolase family protein [Candidatus Obscuribacterales bacterium]
MTIASTIEKKAQTLPQAQTTGKGRKPFRWFAAIEFLLALSVGILALESFCNFAGVGNEEFLEPDSELGVRHIAGKKVVWRLEGYSDENLSSQGLRDREHAIKKPSGVYRIALLGDSATEGMQVALNKTYGSVLESILNQRKPDGRNSKSVEVINFGCSSYSNGQEMLQLEKQVKQFEPDLVILMYNRGDYIENLRDPNTLKAEPRPYFYMGKDGKLTQDNTIMEANKDSFAPNPTTDFLRRNSRIYGILTHTNLTLSLNEMLYSKLRGSILKLLPGGKKNWNVQAVYTHTDPWRISQQIFERVNADCKGMNAKLMLVCFPNIVKDKVYEEQITALKKQANSSGFSYLDLSPDYLQSKDPKTLFLKYHFSDAGHELAAKRISDIIRSDIF